MRMVWLTEKPSFRAASCCRAEVVKGGAGVREISFFSIFSIWNTESLHFSKNASAWPGVANRVSKVAFT